MQWLITNKETLEVLYYLGGIVLALASLFAAWQLFLTKKSLELAKTDILLRSKREAVVLAAQICEKFAGETGPNLRKVSKRLEEQKLLVAPWELNNSNFDETSLRDARNANVWISNLSKNVNVFNDIAGCANEFESISIYFVKGAADEEVAFPSIGIPFCLEVRRLAPLLILARKNNQLSGPFKNTVELYAVWSDRIKKENLEQIKSQAEKNLADISSTSIKPIGSELNLK